MAEDFWKRLSRNLTFVRKRNTVLNALTFLLVIAALFLLVYARAVASHTGDIPWPVYLGVAGCVASLILLNIIFERDWF
jgi:hypothetical protein